MLTWLHNLTQSIIIPSTCGMSGRFLVEYVEVEVSGKPQLDCFQFLFFFGGTPINLILKTLQLSCAGLEGDGERKTRIQKCTLNHYYLFIKSLSHIFWTSVVFSYPGNGARMTMPWKTNWPSWTPPDGDSGGGYVRSTIHLPGIFDVR